MKLSFLTSFEKRIYTALIATLAISTAMNVFLPQGTYGPATLPAPKPVIALVSGIGVAIVYGALGLLGLSFSRRCSFAHLWDESVSNRQRFALPFGIGLALGAFFIVIDAAFGALFGYGGFPHPPFPTSFFASLNAGIGEEVLFRLFFIPVWMAALGWLFRDRVAESALFWFVAVLSAIAFAGGHLPAVLFLTGVKSVAEIPFAVLMEVVLLNSALALCAAHCLRRYGFIAAAGVHFWTDIVWHVIYGLAA